MNSFPSMIGDSDIFYRQHHFVYHQTHYTAGKMMTQSHHMSMMDATRWFVCGQTATDRGQERTCIGPFSTALVADNFYQRYMRSAMLSGTTTLLPTCKYNPFQAWSLRHTYNGSFVATGNKITKLKLEPPGGFLPPSDYPCGL